MDLAIAAFCLAFGAAVAFRLGECFSLRNPRLGQVTIAAALLLAIWMSWTKTYSLLWAEYLPHGSVLLFANTFLLLAIFAGGLFFGLDDISIRRRQFFTCVFTLTATLGIGVVLLRPWIQPLHLADEGKWKDEVCLQTHEASCAPAAAATLLGLHGVDANEREMAALCLSSKNGTYSLAAFRGIQVESQNAGLGTRALVCEPSLIDSVGIDARLPMLALVNYQDQLKFARGGSSKNVYGSRSQTRSRLPQSEDRHAVVLLKRLPQGQFLVADPSVGKVIWAEDYFRNIWVGEGIYLVSK
ncbi:MAG: hypothetical protein AAF483_00395 [Planctomycetota bacterium]